MATWDPLLQLLRLKEAPPLTPTPAALKTPPAPITREALTQWTPTMLYESTAQRAQEQRQSVEQIANLPRTQSEQVIKTGPDWRLWAALALGAATLLLLLLARGR